MKHKLKYLKLFEGLSKKKIPYSYIDAGGKLNIQISLDIYELPPEYDQLTDEITGYIFIYKNQHITEISGFDNLIKVGWCLSIESNQSLIKITRFDKLINIGWDLSIESNQSLTEITGFGNLTSVGNGLRIQSNDSLTEITGFNSLEVVGWRFFIVSNKSLTTITGFSNLTRVVGYMHIHNNPKLVTMSIPGNLVRAVNYGHGYDDGYGIIYNKFLKFKSPGDFINSPVIYQDLVKKFNPGEHGDVVVKQIVENVEEWGNEETKLKIYSLLGKYMTPEHWKLVPTHIQHIYNPDYQGTTGRDVAKVNAGEVYGIF